MLAMTPRTGSTFLCTALREAGQSVEPNEIFNPRGPAQVERDRRHVCSFAEYIASFAADRDATFIFKTGWYDAAPLVPALTRIFPALRVIYLDRQNIAAQAVSQFRAEVSGVWHARPGQVQPEFDATDKFDLARISRIVQTMEQEKRSWEGWFAANRLTPLRLEYRLLETDVREALRRIVGTMKLDLRPDLVAGTGMLKLADTASFDWTERVQKHLFNLS